MPRNVSPKNVPSSDSGIITATIAAAQVAEEQQQYKGHQQRAFHQVGEYRFQRFVEQPGAVVVRGNFHALGQAVFVELRHALVDRRQHFAGVLALAHQHDAGDDIGVIVLPDHALTWHRAHGQSGEVAHQHRRAVAFGDDHVENFFRRAQQPDAAYQNLLAALFDIATAGIGAATLQCGEYLLQADFVVLQLRQIRIHLVLLDRAAEAHDIGHAGQQAQLAADGPILNGAQFLRGVTRALDAVSVDLADGGGQRRQLRLCVLGQIGFAQALQHLLAREVRVRLVVKRQNNERQPELCMREHADHVRHAGKRHFDREGHLLFDFLGGATGEECDHLHLCVGDIRQRFDRQLFKRQYAAANEQNHSQQDEQRLVQGERDEALHGWRIYFCTRRGCSICCNINAPSTTTFSPSFRPLRISVRVSRMSPALTARRVYLPPPSSMNT